MTRFQRASGLVILLVTLVAFGFGLPALSAQGPATRTLATDTVVGTAYGYVTLPAGWDLDLASAALVQPTITQGDVSVVVSDGVWLEGSASLLGNIGSMVYDGGFSVPDDVPDDDGLLAGLKDLSAIEADLQADLVAPDRQDFRITADETSAEGDPLWIDVIRYGELITVVVVRGPQSEVSQHVDQIQAIGDSLVIDAIEIGEVTP